MRRSFPLLENGYLTRTETSLDISRMTKRNQIIQRMLFIIDYYVGEMASLEITEIPFSHFFPATFIKARWPRSIDYFARQDKLCGVTWSSNMDLCASWFEHISHFSRQSWYLSLFHPIKTIHQISRNPFRYNASRPTLYNKPTI